MSDSDGVGFLSRWARRKAETRRGVESSVPKAAAPLPSPLPDAEAHLVPAAQTGPAAPLDPNTEGATPVAPPPTLEDVARLTRDSDYTRFVAADVDPGVRNAAMKKLFSDPHFNVMDGLDVYIDDYGKPDPLPPGMLRRLAQSRFLGLFDDEAEGAEPAPARSAADAAPAALAAPTTAPDEDPDLRLQPDDAAGPERHGPDRAGPDEDATGQR